MEQARYAGNDPRRPSYRDANRMFPTPQAFDAKDIQRSPSALARAKKKGGCRNLREEIKGQGKLNATWVGALMGYPQNWTDLDTPSTRENNFPEKWIKGAWEDGIPRTTTTKPGRVDGLKQLGNSVIPQIPFIIGKAIMEIENNDNN